MPRRGVAAQSLRAWLRGALSAASAAADYFRKPQPTGAKRVRDEQLKVRAQAKTAEEGLSGPWTDVLRALSEAVDETCWAAQDAERLGAGYHPRLARMATDLRQGLIELDAALGSAMADPSPRLVGAKKLALEVERRRRQTRAELVEEPSLPAELKLRAPLDRLSAAAEALQKGADVLGHLSVESSR